MTFKTEFCFIYFKLAFDKQNTSSAYLHEKEKVSYNMKPMLVEFYMV